MKPKNNCDTKSYKKLNLNTYKVLCCNNFKELIGSSNIKIYIV